MLRRNLCHFEKIFKPFVAKYTFPLNETLYPLKVSYFTGNFSSSYSKVEEAPNLNYASGMAFNHGGKSLEQVEVALNNWLKPQMLGESWDNVGLLVGSGKSEKNEKVINNIMLCNDLRPVVLEEAVEKNVDMIIAYHPIIFSGLKRVSYDSWQERIVARCIANDISIYSPHTTLDSTVGGINDRVLNAFRTDGNSGSQLRPIIPSKFIGKETCELKVSSSPEVISKLFESVSFHRFSEVLLSLISDEISASITLYGKPETTAEVAKFISDLDLPDIQQSMNESPQNAVFGAGRIVDLIEPLDLDDAVETLKRHLGLGYVQLAYGGRPTIKSAAVCVGSGSSLLKPIAGQVDLLITGEMSHHDILACVEAKSSVILCNHCSSERHYLPDLAKVLKVVTGLNNVFVSEEDASPLRLVL